MPDEIDLESLKSQGGLQDGEEALPDEPTPANTQATQVVIFLSRIKNSSLVIDIFLI